MDRLLKQFGYLEFSASNAMFGPMQWGPIRKAARKVYDLARPAREGLAPAAGELGEDEGVHHDPLDRRGSQRRTSAGREPDGIVDPGDFERVRDGLTDRLASFVDPKTGRRPVEAVYAARGDLQGQARATTRQTS